MSERNEASRRLSYLLKEPNKREAQRPAGARYGRCVRGIRFNGKHKRLGEFPDQSITQLTGFPRHPVVALQNAGPDGSVDVQVLLHQSAFGPPGYSGAVVPPLRDPLRSVWMHLRAKEWEWTPECWYTIDGDLITVYSDDTGVDPD